MVKSNYRNGDNATTVSFIFNSKEKASDFAETDGINGWLPINSDKHVYSNWDPVISKRGAFNKYMNPFNMQRNKKINVNYTKEMCPRTLDILSRTVNISINPDWSEGKVSEIIQAAKLFRK